MSKRKNQNSTSTTPAAKKMSDQQGESSASPPEEKMFHYHQDRIDVTSLYLATKLADVHFVFDSDDGSVKRIPAHRNLLAVTSDVFEKMFCGGLKESGDVKIIDASEAAFKEFLQFFYLNDVKLSAENVGSVLYLGNKYNVENCVDACVKFLTDDLSNENVCIALSLAILYEQKELTKTCEKQIILNTVEIFKSAGFLECSKEALAYILQMNLLSCSEVDVFEACMEWVRAKSKQQVVSKAMVDNHLGESYYQIRFASMNPKEFFTLKTKYNAVLSSDFEAIIRLIDGVDTDSEHFNTTPRQVEWIEGKDAIIKCSRDFNYLQGMWQVLDIEEKTTFSTNVPLVLGNFLCHVIRVDENGEKFLRSNLSVEMKITEARELHNANVKVLCNMPVKLSTSGTTVSLPHPILIRPDYFYTIYIKGFPDCHYSRSCELKSSVFRKSNIKIEFHNDKVVDGKIAGLIYSLKFNKI